MSQANNSENPTAVTGLSLTLLSAISCLYLQTKKDANGVNSVTNAKKGQKALPPLASPERHDSPRGSNGNLDAELVFANLPPTNDPKLALLRKRRGLSEDGNHHGSQGSNSPSQTIHNRLNKSNSHDRIEKVPSFSKSPSFYELSKEADDHAVPITNNHAALTSSSNDGQALATLGLEQPMVIAMVGLPARGKSYLVKMIMRYLKWTGFESRMFNVGSYRRQVGLASADAHFFDSSNAESKQIRENLAMAVQDEMYKWLHETMEAKRRVAIFDATNTTKNRRLALAKRARSENVFLLFVESICDDEEVLKHDYKGMDIETARRDFYSRVKEYEKVYETITDDEDNSQISYIKLINVGQKVITRNCYGYLPSQVAFYLQNVHIQPRKIYLTYLAEFVEKTLGLAENISGCESGQLTPLGIEYTENFTNYLLYEQQYGGLVDKGKEIIILTGTSNIHYQCVSLLKEKTNFKCFHTPLLNELRGGDLHGLSKDEIRILYPEEWKKRNNDKLNYRYPGVGGESYLDVIERVRPVIIELERQRRSIFVICHMAVLRCIYAYFMGVPQEDLPFKEFETHRLYELTPGPFGCSCTIIHPHSVNESTDESNNVDDNDASHYIPIVCNPNLLPQNPNIVPVPPSQKVLHDNTKHQNSCEPVKTATTN
eukprot:CAMPEP_0173146218 /NCGR_PEP_ID=MMETSP1105-20130129/8358_1 /TAXON_ID=2985 /ORGANISM="Ochromonas sp., Strain BG-1" /LENGTH=657 /DNA_ID=CAMNT_0014060369 /DNA_START=226 /DNA_END=2199 /DNA_ORIENTATION=+